MLVLSRFKGEKIIIQVPGAGPVEVVVADIHPEAKRVRLGVQAPSSVVIDRAEVHEAKRTGA